MEDGDKSVGIRPAEAIQPVGVVFDIEAVAATASKKVISRSQ